jgi:nucleoid DNA-binding protein
VRIKNENDYFTKDLIRDVGFEANFTMVDVDIIYQAMVKVIAEKLGEGKNIYLDRFIMIRPKKFKARKTWNNDAKAITEYPETIRLAARPSKVMSKIVREKLMNINDEVLEDEEDFK